MGNDIVCYIERLDPNTLYFVPAVVYRNLPSRHTAPPSVDCNYANKSVRATDPECARTANEACVF